MKICDSIKCAQSKLSYCMKGKIKWESILEQTASVVKPELL